MSYGDNDFVKNEDEYYNEYEHSEKANDALPESRQKRYIIDGFRNPPSTFIIGA